MEKELAKKIRKKLRLVKLLKKNINRLLGVFGLRLARKKKTNNLWLKNREISAVIDIGANTGQFAKFINEILPGVKIYSFEPVKTFFEKLRNNTSNLNVDAFNLALGEKTGEAEINVSRHGPSSSLLKMDKLHENLYPNSAYDHREKVHLSTLDNEMVKLGVKGKYLIKIDVQGFENEVIEGGKITMAGAEVVIIETCYVQLYKNQKLFDGIYRIMRDLGFKFMGNLFQSENQKDGSVVFADAIFLK